VSRLDFILETLTHY